uniref:Uncharacterized protein n=1 Tax=Aureoumbra lagunensis TaxID=44058 RepID=A0A7S3NNT0_9STRA|mmetsp:Transcript_12945/g.17337  ORF Transcript_12945/g.17337 Transcript_12945/m.17337 type:complete len:109 (-) Transcript_12945:61-387(-)
MIRQLGLSTSCRRNFSGETGLIKRAHVPLIKFLGKRNHVKRDQTKDIKETKEVKPPTSTAHAKQDITPIIMNPQDTQNFLALGAFYGRPPVSDEEIAAVASGGATLLE